VNLAPRGGRGPFVLEKWYADTLMPDGSVLLLYLGWMRVLGVPVARCTAELFRPGAQPVRGDAPAPAISGGPGRLDFGPARIDGDLLQWQTEGLSGVLRFSPRHPSIALREPFLELGGRRLLWTVEIPDADVDGELRWPGGRLRVRGRGYRDRVWHDLLPWRFPVRELRWGRSAAGLHACTWVAARTENGKISARWEDGKLISGEAPGPRLGSPRVLVESAVADIEGLRLGALRPLLRRLTGDPYEVKWAAPATLRGAAGWAVHEVVRWH